MKMMQRLMFTSLLVCSGHSMVQADHSKKVGAKKYVADLLKRYKATKNSDQINNDLKQDQATKHHVYSRFVKAHRDDYHHRNPSVQIPKKKAILKEIDRLVQTVDLQTRRILAEFRNIFQQQK